MDSTGSSSSLPEGTFFSACVFLMLLQGWWSRAPTFQAWVPHARLAVFAAATAALPSALKRFPQHRRILISLHRMMFVAVLPERDILIREMQVSPCAGFFGWLLDAARLLMASRASRLLILGLGPQLDLPTHLLVHTACLLCLQPPLTSYCMQPWLTSDLMRSRISLLHAVGSTTMVGIVPRDYPSGGPYRQCVAALSFICILFGWLPPTALVVRAHCKAMLLKRQQQPCGDATRLGATGWRWSGTSGPCALSAASLGTPRGPAAAPIPRIGGSSAGGGWAWGRMLARCKVGLDWVVCWVMDLLFAKSLPADLKLHVCGTVVVACWLTGTFFAAHLVH